MLQAAHQDAGPGLGVTDKFLQLAALDARRHVRLKTSGMVLQCAGYGEAVANGGVEFVGNARHHGAQRRHLLGAHQLGLGNGQMLQRFAEFAGPFIDALLQPGIEAQHVFLVLVLLGNVLIGQHHQRLVSQSNRPA